MKLTKHTNIVQRKNFTCSVSLNAEGIKFALELFNADNDLTLEEIMKAIIRGDIMNEINKGDTQ